MQPIRRQRFTFSLSFSIMFTKLLSWVGTAGAQPPALKLFVLEYGQNQVVNQSVFSPGINEGVGRSMPIHCYLIQHPKGTLLWGTGLNDAHFAGGRIRRGLW